MLPATLVVALGSTMLTGCSGDPPRPSAATAGRDVPTAAWDDPAAAPRAGQVGKAGSPCPLPVTFDLAKSYRPAAVPAGVAEQGGFALRCEIDAKPAGHLGFLRVWTAGGAGADPAQALDMFLAGERGLLGRQTRVTKAGSLPADETTYRTDDAEIDSHRQERLLAASTPAGVVILELGGLDLEEHRQMLPAFVLAKQSLTVAS